MKSMDRKYITLESIHCILLPHAYHPPAAARVVPILRHVDLCRDSSDAGVRLVGVISVASTAMVLLVFSSCSVVWLFCTYVPFAGGGGGTVDGWSHHTLCKGRPT